MHMHSKVGIKIREWHMQVAQRQLLLDTVILHKLSILHVPVCVHGVSCQHPVHLTYSSMSCVEVSSFAN